MQKIIYNKKVIYLFMLLIAFSCTEVISFDNDIPTIDSIAMNSFIQLSEEDTTWHKINLYISDNDGYDDIDSVIFYIRRDSLYSELCEVDLIQDTAFSKIIDFPLLYTACTGDIDSSSLKICEELSLDECELSNECLLNTNTTQFSYYTLIPFKPLFTFSNEGELTDCGRYGRMSFQFSVKDLSGNKSLSPIVELNICESEECIE